MKSSGPFNNKQIAYSACEDAECPLSVSVQYYLTTKHWLDNMIIHLQGQHVHLWAAALHTRGGSGFAERAEGRTGEAGGRVRGARETLGAAGAVGCCGNASWSSWRSWSLWDDRWTATPDPRARRTSSQPSGDSPSSELGQDGRIWHEKGMGIKSKESHMCVSFLFSSFALNHLQLRSSKLRQRSQRLSSLAQSGRGNRAETQPRWCQLPYDLGFIFRQDSKKDSSASYIFCNSSSSLKRRKREKRRGKKASSYCQIDCLYTYLKKKRFMLCTV